MPQACRHHVEGSPTPSTRLQTSAEASPRVPTCTSWRPDEYPFFSAAQGGPDGDRRPPSLRYLDAGHNGLIGT